MSNYSLGVMRLQELSAAKPARNSRPADWPQHTPRAHQFDWEAEEDATQVD